MFELGYSVQAIVGLRDLGEENVRFLAPGAHEFLKVRNALEYGVCTGGSDKPTDTHQLRPMFERGAEESDEGVARWRDLQRVEVW